MTRATAATGWCRAGRGLATRPVADASPCSSFPMSQSTWSELDVWSAPAQTGPRPPLRTCVFVRAGCGKSDLARLLISKLYEQTPPGGMLIFDPEGERTLPDQLGIPGPVSVPHLTSTPVAAFRELLVK